MLFEMNPSVRILRGSSHLAANSVVYWATWHTSSYGVPLVAYLANRDSSFHWPCVVHKCLLRHLFVIPADWLHTALR